MRSEKHDQREDPVRHADYAVHARGLTKRFGDTQALAGIDLTARQGTVLGVLGPNGAGKTTAVRILATLTAADSGSATVGGYDVRRRRVAPRRGQPGRPDRGSTPACSPV